MKTRISIILLVVVLFVGAWGAWVKLPLWRDAIFHTDNDAVLVMASGAEFPTNRWFVRGDQLRFSIFQDNREGKIVVEYLVENYEEDQKARLRIGDSEYWAILVRSRFQSSNNHCEWWLKPGDRMEEVEQVVSGNAEPSAR